LVVQPLRRISFPVFCGGNEAGYAPAFWVLVFSAAITWVFAKSIDNAASLGQAFGITGGIGYAIYYLSFAVAAFTIYFIRTRGGHMALSGFLVSKYGTICARLFLIAIGIRLFNEVWSNAKVSAPYFGSEGSIEYWSAAGLITAFTLFYAWRGGLRSSLLTDAGQMLLAVVLLVAVMIFVFPLLVRTGLPDVPPAAHLAGITFYGARADLGVELSIPCPGSDRPGVFDQTEIHGEGVSGRRIDRWWLCTSVQQRRSDGCRDRVGAHGVRVAHVTGVQRRHAHQRRLDHRFYLREQRKTHRRGLAKQRRRPRSSSAYYRPANHDIYRAIG
jgi:hypothetical protein